MLLPICLEYEQVCIHPLRAADIDRYEQFVEEIYQLLSDEETLHFIPEKRLRSFQEAENWLKSATLNFHCGHNYLHFITERTSGKLLGMVDIFTPGKVKEHYRLESYPYFLEFYLRGKVRGRKIMTKLLPLIIEELDKRNIQSVAAVINKNNFAALKVIEKAGFEFRARFDARQNLYQLSLSA